MTKSLFLLALGSALLSAKEHVIKVAPFETSLTFEATFLPAETTVLKLTPKEWTKFSIDQVVPHGAAVAKGDTIISFDQKDYLKDVEETAADLAASKLSLALAERELAELEITTPRKLEEAKIVFDRKKEALEYFKNTDREIQEKSARENMAFAKRRLENYEEELKQLLKMYEEDGVTEETEEIILKRQRSDVETARFNFERAALSTARTLKKRIPEQAIDLERSLDTAKLTFETANLNLPRKLEEKRLAVAKQQRKIAEAIEKKSDLELDERLFKFIAPEDGFVYYGKLTEDTWTLGSTAKFLFADGNAPLKTPILSFVAEDASLQLSASVSQKERLQLSSGLAGTAEVEGLDDVTFPVEILKIDHFPNPDRKYGVRLKITLPEDSPIVIGMKAKVKIITYQNEEAFSVPTAALTTEDGESTLRIKMADGKDEIRPVKIGRRTSDRVEILEGVSPDQVILIPDKE